VDDVARDFQALEVAELRATLARDLEQLDSHGPGAPGLQTRIDRTRAALTALGVPEEDP